MLPPPDRCHATITQVTPTPCPHGYTWQCGRVPFVVHLLRLDLLTTYCGITEETADTEGGYAVPPGMIGSTCGHCRSEVGRERSLGQAVSPMEVEGALDRWRSERDPATGARLARPAAPADFYAHWPDTCPRCGGPAYLGAGTAVDCLRRCT